MKQHLSTRVLLAGSLAVLGMVGSLVAADRSATAMSTAATAFLGALTPAQRQQATFAFDTDERQLKHMEAKAAASMRRPSAIGRASWPNSRSKGARW